jgi:hypothetical protein
MFEIINSYNIGFSEFDFLIDIPKLISCSLLFLNV